MRRLLRGATVVDGSGAPAFDADVLVDGDRIAGVGGIEPDGDTEVVDLAGLVLCPGFIDIHTHYDAQVLWDRDLTPSCWHGVTTVVMGNCGFSIAPTRAEHRDVIIKTLENVEGMTAAALAEGIPWGFETFPEFLAAVDAEPLRLNVAAMVGHSPLRMYVLGTEATERVATTEEMQTMNRLLAEALEAGALGLATSKSPKHAGAGGRPVPSRLASAEELEGLVGVLTATGRGVLQVTPGDELSPRALADLAARTGVTVSWAALTTGRSRPAMEMLDESEAYPAQIWPQISCRPVVMQITLEDPFPFAASKSPAFKEILQLPREERAVRYGDRGWLDRARQEIEVSWRHQWARMTVAESAKFPELLGRTVADIAAQWGVPPLDAMVEISTAENLKARFTVILFNDDEEELGRLLLDDRTILGLSDAGAHASQLCDACFSTYLLQRWVREKGTLTLEHAVWRLTGQPAEVFGLPGRGRITPGAVADLVAFDPDTVGVVEPLERVFDLPAGEDRLIAHSRGVEHVWVNGVPIRAGSRDLDERPGRLLRHGV